MQKTDRSSVAESPIQSSDDSSLMASFQGPLPPPSMLAQYEEILPGAAERILVLLESETAHRHGVELQCVNAEIDSQKSISDEAKRGQWLAFC